jgi:signal transduction histidine kinase/CheY-like chemotaxis protein
MAEPFPSAGEPGAAASSEFIPAAHRILASTLRSIGGHHARLYRLSPDTGAFACVAFAGEAGTSGAEIAFSRLVARGGSALGTRNVGAERACALDPAARDRSATRTHGALAVAAVRVEGAVVGTLVLADRTGRRYTDRDLAFLSAAADQMALRLETCRLRAELARERGQAGKLARVGEKLDASQAQLVQAQKMEAIGQLAGGVAHDFNNLLTVIGGRSSLLLRRLRPDDPARRDIELIASTADRAASLTRQLLAFSRKQVLQPKPINLNTLVAGVAPMLKRLIGEHIEIVIVPARNLGSVMADPGQMEQVIVNLVVNARDAMPEGGTLRIETSDHEVPEGGLAAHGGRVPPGPYITVSIQDTGSGMDPATLARIFEPFFTTKAPGKGTGLGLSTVHGIVHQSGGHLAVESAPGRGTTFTIYLPRIQEPAGAAETRENLRPSLVGGAGTVLLVEDDEELRRLASDILQAAGYTVVEAGDPLEALVLGEERPGPIDLLLTDMVMPAMRGPELAARLRATRPGLRVLFMSGYADEVAGVGRAGDPAPAFLPKPFSPHELTTKVREILLARW